jgi:hypothetical protein
MQSYAMIVDTSLNEAGLDSLEKKTKTSKRLEIQGKNA